MAPDENELRLPDTKTGARAVSLSPAAVKLLAGLPRLPGNPWVIPGRKPGGRLSSLDYVWRIIREQAGLEDVRIHDLRHSYASRALALGESLPMIGKLLGHSQIETTARYAHQARDSVREAAERVAESIATDYPGLRPDGRVRRCMIFAIHRDLQILPSRTHELTEKPSPFAIANHEATSRQHSPEKTTF